MDLAFRFTEEKYANKAEVMKDLNTSLVDNIWSNILAYRKQYYISLGLRTFANNQYVLCNSQSLIAKSASNEMRYLRVMRELNGVSLEDYPSLEARSFNAILVEIAKNNRLDYNDMRIRSILRNEIKSLDKDNEIILNYVRALNYVKAYYNNDLNLNYFHDLHKILTNADSSSFRNLNDNDHANKVVIDRIYTSAPFNLIEPLLLELCNFINNNQDFNALLKAYISYFYINIVKPFSSYSDEVAVLVAKSILAKENLGEFSFVIPFEKILNHNDELMSKLVNDSQKYNDATYYVRHCLEVNETILNDYINVVINFKTQNIKEEFYSVDEVKVAPTPKVEPVIESTPVIEEVKPLVEERKIEPKPVAANEAKEVKRGQLAFDMIPEALDEKEAARLEVHLLESDPSLRKGEARFYARHCTLGKSYTIQQFKKCNGCVYETARTGMEHLVELGYYRKEAVKNKFIYTPINRRNS